MNTRTLTVAVSVSIVLTIGAGCAQPTGDDLQTHISRPLTSAATVPGYTHALSRSRFAIGGNQSGKSEFGLQKTIGDYGVFATLPATGWTMGIPNGDAPTRSVAPLSASADVHNQAVKDYFLGAGLPASQIGSVTAHASVYGTKGPQDASGPTPLKFANYSSVLSRSIEGIPIAESFAWAIINANNDVVEEAVYWPDVSQAAVDAGKALQSVLSDPAKGPAFLQALPKSFPAGQVVVHHTPCVGGASEAVATYDVLDRGSIGMARQRHFSSSGQEVTLAAETVAIAPNTPKVRP